MSPTDVGESESDGQLICHTATNAPGVLLSSEMPRWNIGVGDRGDWLVFLKFRH
jgi:hypothetical protein